jgi:hypothetical protein
VWHDRDPDLPVWRIEFQFWRKALTSFGVTSMGAFLDNRQALWEYGCQWLSLRVPTSDPNRSRHMHPVAWNVTSLDAATEANIRALLEKAVV